MPYERHPTLTPAPVSGDTPATMQDVFTATNEHAAECAERRATQAQHDAEEAAAKRATMWSSITDLKLVVAELKLVVSRMEESGKRRVRHALAIAAIAATLLGGAGIFIARYTLIGVWNEQFDKRFPPGSVIHHVEAPKPSAERYATMVQP